VVVDIKKPVEIALHAERTRTLKERDDTAYAKGIIKGREQMIKEIEGRIEGMVTDLLFDRDMEWTRIHEMIKMRAPISVKDKEYYQKPFSDILSVLKEKV
jgi:hypothetical protein